MPLLMDQLSDEKSIEEIEADSYFLMETFLVNYKENFSTGFLGVQQKIKRLEQLLNVCDRKLLEHLRNQGIELVVFGFRWFFCFLIREFPLILSIYLMDYLFLEDIIVGSELLLFLVLGLLMKFSYDLQ